MFIQCLVNMSFDFLLHKADAIPNWVLEENNALWAFLGGYSDAEAHIGISGGKASFRLSTADFNILLTIHSRLIQYEIEAPTPYVWLKKGYTNSRGAITRKDIWRLGVYSAENLRRLLENLLPYLRHQKRKKDAQRVIQFLAMK